MPTVSPLRTLPAALLLSAACAAPALAGQRHTVWAYPPGAGPKGAVELETWMTTTKEAKDAPSEAEYRVEVENGVTDDVSLDTYLGIFTQDPQRGFRLDRFAASLRANLFGEKVRDRIDVTGYFEVERDVELGNPWEFEAILIGGHSYGRFSYDFNLAYESELSANAFRSDTRELRGIAGAWYEVTPRLSAGAEFVAENDLGKGFGTSVGPTVSIVLTDKTWVAVGPQFGLNGEADKLKVRALFGIFF